MIRLYDMVSGNLLSSEGGSSSTANRNRKQQIIKNPTHALQLQEILPETERGPFGPPPDLMEKSIDLFIDKQ